MPERFVLYADVEVHEYGEEDLLRRVGPFSPGEDYEDDPEGAKALLEEHMLRAGDDVVNIIVVPL